MMQFGEATREIETDACAIVEDGLRLVVKLVIALEDIFTLALRNTLARISHTDLHLTFGHIKRNIDASATGRELQGVGEQIRDNLLKFVAISPGLEYIRHPNAGNRDAFLAGIELEGVADIIHGLCHIGLFHMKAQGVVLELIEVHELIDELEHALDAALGHAEQRAILTTEVTAAHKLPHGACHHRERCAELMGNVGEEAHVHLVRAQLLLFLHLCLTGGTAGNHHAAGIAIEIPGKSRGEREIDEPCPPRISRRGSNGNAQRTFIGEALVTGIIGSLHAEGVMTGRQIGIAGRMVVARINPVAIEAVEFIIIMYALILPEVERSIRDAEAILVVAQTYLLTTVEHGLNGPVGRRPHQLVVDLQMAEFQGNLSERIDIGGVEHGDTVGTTEDQTAIRQLTRGTIDKLIASNTVGLIERRDAPRLTIPAIQAFHRSHPDITLNVFLDAAHIRAGETRDARHLVSLQIVTQKSVAHGTDPYVAFGILNHISRNVHTATDALSHRRDIEFGELPRLGVHLENLLEEGRDEQLSITEPQQRGNEAEVGIKGLFHDGCATAWESHDVVTAGRCPNHAIVCLLEIHHPKCGCLTEYGQP